MSSERPAIAVVMPVYNRASTVGRAIQSVLDQDFRQFELIIVDDGSTDGSADAIASFTDPRIQFIRLPTNAGGNAARNRGIEASSTPLITFLDSDDHYLPEKLGFAVDYFRAHADVDILLDSFIKSYPERDYPDIELKNPLLNDNRQILEALFTRRIWKATPGITARRETVLAAGKFDEGLKRRQDFDFILRLAKHGRMATTDQLLWVKTYAAQTISGDLGNFVESTLAFYRRHPEYYDNPVYRQGFAHDLGRHFVRLLRRGKFAAALRDAKPLANELGTARLVSLVAGGALRFRQRRQAIKQQAYSDVEARR
jgi:glycosyltransferase involved in cell wall biosynthesis